MNTITKLVVLGMLYLLVGNLNAQDNNQKTNNQYKIESLTDLKETIKKEERGYLKKEVEAINRRLDSGEITQEEAEKLKQDAAEKRARNIENRLAIIDNKIELLKRNAEGYDNDDTDKGDYIGFTIGGDDETFAGFRIKNRNRYRKYDKRTTSDFVVAAGFNNAIVEGEQLADSPYKFAGSRFFEIGWAWKTRVFDNSNVLRFKYGVSFMMNGLKPTDNKYFVVQNDQTVLEEFPYDLKKSKLTLTNLVFPVHFELGPSRKIEREDYFRYSTHRQFKIGFGGYVGFNIGTRQKLKYTADGNRMKDKIKGGYNTSGLVYGLSGYIGVDDVALYIKYDLNPIFKHQTIDQNNISLGVRFDLD